MTIQKIRASRVNTVTADDFVGEVGMLFYNEDLGDLRVSDGVNPGGIPLALGGSGDGGSYTLPTASATTKGGVKVDGATITVANQVISIGTVPYSKLTDTPTIPTNTSQLTNGAGFITSSALSTYALSSSVPTNTNQLTNGAGYITNSALTGYATESYVTGRGYITNSSLSGYATESYVTGRGYLSEVPEATGSIKGGIKLGRGLTKNAGGVVDAFSGSYNDLTDKPSIPIDINQLADEDGLLNGTGSYSLPTASSTVKGGVKIGTNINIVDGVISVDLPDLSGYALTVDVPSITGLATELYVTSQGYITTADLPDLTGYALTADIPSIAGLATESFVTSQGYITSADLPDLSSYALTANVPTDINQLSDIDSLLGSGNASVTVGEAAPTLPEEGNLWWDAASGNLFINYDNTWVIAVRNDPSITSYNELTDTPTALSEFTNDTNYITAADVPTALSEFTNDTNYITSADVPAVPTDVSAFRNDSGYLTFNANGTFSIQRFASEPVNPQAGQMALADGDLWNPLSHTDNIPYMVIYTGTSWLGLGGVTMDQVYMAILELGSTT